LARIALNEDYGDWAEHLVTRPGFDLAEFRVSMATEAFSYPFSDPFDSVIAATAKVMDLPLITKDADITDFELVEIYW